MNKNILELTDIANNVDKNNIKKTNELLFSMNKTIILVNRFFEVYILNLLNNSLDLPNINNELIECIFRVISNPNACKKSIDPLESKLYKFYSNEFLYVKTKITLTNNGKLNIKLIRPNNIKISLVDQKNLQKCTPKHNFLKHPSISIVISIKSNIILYFYKHLYYFLYFLLKQNEIINNIKKDDLKHIICSIITSIESKIKYKNTKLDENTVENINNMLNNSSILYELYNEEGHIIENKLKLMYKMAKFREYNNDSNKLLIISQRHKIIFKHITIDLSAFNEPVTELLFNNIGAKKSMKEIMKNDDIFNDFVSELYEIEYKNNYYFNKLKLTVLSYLLFFNINIKNAYLIKKSRIEALCYNVPCIKIPCIKI
jgi:hypothetical protein